MYRILWHVSKFKKQLEELKDDERGLPELESDVDDVSASDGGSPKAVQTMTLKLDNCHLRFLPKNNFDGVDKELDAIKLRFVSILDFCIVCRGVLGSVCFVTGSEPIF